MIATVLKAVASLILCLIAGDIAGMIFLVFVEILPFELFSAPLAYVTWFVFGVFVGLSAYNVAGTWALPKGDGAADWTQRPEAVRVGLVVVATQAATIGALTYGFHRLYWSQGVSGEYYVPDSAPHSITYFVAVLGSIVAARFMMMPTRNTSSTPFR